MHVLLAKWLRMKVRLFLVRHESCITERLWRIKLRHGMEESCNCTIIVCKVDKGNKRKINLLSLVGKIYDSIFFKKLLWMIKISTFRSGIGCADQIFAFKLLERRKRNYILILWTCIKRLTELIRYWQESSEWNQKYVSEWGVWNGK